MYLLLKAKDACYTACTFMVKTITLRTDEKNGKTKKAL
jgi:hypothetical protein